MPRKYVSSAKQSLPEGYLFIREYAEKYQITQYVAYAHCQMNRIPSIRHCGRQALKDVPPPKPNEIGWYR